MLSKKLLRLILFKIIVFFSSVNAFKAYTKCTYDNGHNWIAWNGRMYHYDPDKYDADFQSQYFPESYPHDGEGVYIISCKDENGKEGTLSEDVAGGVNWENICKRDYSYNNENATIIIKRNGDSCSDGFTEIIWDSNNNNWTENLNNSGNNEGTTENTEVSFKEIPDCPELYDNKRECSGNGIAETYCYSAKNKKLIGFSSTNSNQNDCDIAFDLTESKVNILNLDENIKSADLTTNNINIENIVIYDCDESTCQRVTGLIKHKSASNDSWSYSYIGTSTGVNSEIDLCSDGNSDREYLVYDNDKEDAKVYKCKESSAMKFEGENGKNVCVDGTSIIWNVRSEALCKAESDCNNYYDCTEGICILSRKNSITVRDNDCKPSTGVENCSEGYHLTNNDGTALATSEGKLWYCDTENCKNLENYAGYFRNADDSNKPNILCVNNDGLNKCEKVEIKSESCSSTGEVITKTQGGDDYALCTSTSGSGLLLSESESKQYMVAIDKTNGLYEIKPNTDADDKKTQFYLVVLVDTDANVRVVREIEPIRYRYTNGKNDPLIYDRSAAQDAKKGEEETAICKADHDPFEYKLDQWTEALQTNKFADFYIVDN